MAYNTLSAYGITSGNLEISLVISELIKDAIIERIGETIEWKNTKRIKDKDVADVLKIAGLTVRTHYYYKWLLEIIEEGDV